MNILFVAECDYVKSIIFDLHILAERMALKGHQVYILDWNQFNGLDGEAHTISGRLYPESSVTVRRAPVMRSKFMSVIGAPTDAVLKAVTEWDIDVIVLYAALVMGCQTIIAAKRLGIPVVCRMIDRRFILWQNAYSWWSKAAESFTFRYADLILPITVNYADCVASLGGARKHIKLLNFPIDLSVFKPTPYSASHDIVWVGNLYHFSGVHLLLEQWPKLVAAVPDVTFTIVGGGDPQMLNKVCETAERYKAMVRFAGYVDFRNLPAYINQAGVCINFMDGGQASQDVYSAKVLQYMACGRPVVSSKTPGLCNTIPDNAGVWFAPDVNVATRAIVTLLQRSKMAEYMGVIGRKWIEQHCDADKVADKFEGHLIEVVNEKTA